MLQLAIPMGRHRSKAPVLGWKSSACRSAEGRDRSLHINRVLSEILFLDQPQLHRIQPTDTIFCEPAALPNILHAIAGVSETRSSWARQP